MQQPQQTTDIPDRWTQHQRRNHNKTTTQFFSCAVCRDRAVFQSAEALREHALTTHPSEMPTAGKAENDKDDKTRRAPFRAKYEAESSLQKRSATFPRSPSPVQAPASPIPCASATVTVTVTSLVIRLAEAGRLTLLLAPPS